MLLFVFGKRKEKNSVFSEKEIIVAYVYTFFVLKNLLISV